MYNRGLKFADEAWSELPEAPSCHGEPADYCSREGANALKEKIEAYWRERGMHVMIALHNVGFHPAIRAARYDVRSDMINGMPRMAAVRKPQVLDANGQDEAANDGDIDFE